MRGDCGCLQGFKSATWEEALTAAKDAMLKVKGNELRFIAGKLTDAETLIAAKVWPDSFSCFTPLLALQTSRWPCSSASVAIFSV